MKSCFFIGHREASEDVYPKLYGAIEQCIEEYNVSEYIVGHYGNFDRLVKRALIQAKHKYPHIRLVLLLPYRPGEHTAALMKDFDDSVYPQGLESVPYRYAIVRANRYMIDSVDCLIAYVTHPASNAYNLVEYAKGKADKGKLRIWNISTL